MTSETIYEVAIIGAGLGGLGMGISLARSGERSFVILDKADSVGGTWRDNTYPGASCDLRSHLYWFSFDEQPDWSRVYAFQPEILANIERLTDRNGLRPHLRLGTEVTGAQWDAGVWTAFVADGSAVRARHLVSAWGQLNRPALPKIKGIPTFAGEYWHSARWKHDIDLSGKRVACIGVGASAVQIIPEIAQEVATLSVFQREPPYVIPRADRAYEPHERATYREDPNALQNSRNEIYTEHESWIGVTTLGTQTARDFTAAARAHLESQVADHELREKLWPNYPIGCKRILISDSYYPALCRDNVRVVTAGIDGIEPGGVRTSDGVVHQVDVIVYATGFDSQALDAGISIVGQHGITLSEAWADGAEAHLGISVAGFPNFSMLYGPNTNLAHNSIIAMLECQFGYVLKKIAAASADSGSLDVRSQVQRQFVEQLKWAFRDSAYTSGCNSWYVDTNGRITNNWMGSVEDYRKATTEFDLSDFQAV